MQNLRHLLVSFFLLLAVYFPQPVSAHGNEPRLEISAERLNPGSVLDIRGVDFEFEERVDLALVGAQTETSLGTVLADVEGIFLLSVTLPADMLEGNYVVRATTDDHEVDSPVIVIWGTAMLEGGGEGLRDEDDGLLAPMPTVMPAGPSTSVPQQQGQAETAPGLNIPLLASGVFAVVVILALLASRLVRGARR